MIYAKHVVFMFMYWFCVLIFIRLKLIEDATRMKKEWMMRYHDCGNLDIPMSIAGIKKKDNQENMKEKSGLIN